MSVGAIELFGLLLLTMLGFLLPLLTILVPLFSKGTEMLTAKYENERTQSEKSIEKEIKKRQSGKGFDYGSLEKTIKTLKENKKIAESRLSLLNPQKLIARIFIPLIIAFAAVLVALQKIPPAMLVITLVIGLVAFFDALRVLWMSSLVLAEASKVVSDSREDYESNVVELLSALVEMGTAENLLLKSENIMIRFNKVILTEETNLTFSTNKKYEIPVVIINGEDRMAKNIELGLAFPLDFLIEKTGNIHSIYSGTDEQIVRFRAGFIQANTNNLKGNLVVTFLKTGQFKARSFIKGENLRSRQFDYSIQVID